ncbi:SDR family oxidoreductase, partial [Acinetobacter baumannii]|uniref:SDR family oxidoreductase n=1 Tax=Acinetobacter baumannii TaxID=470 RepID=UPI001D1715C4
SYPSCLLNLSSLRELSLSNLYATKPLEDVILAMVPQKRLLSVEEIADYAIFLASEKAGGVTGQAVVMDGGYTAQ